MYRFVSTILLFFLFAVPLVAMAGDEVDYSAPYMVLEDGELVTKYPAKEHEGGTPQQQDSVADFWIIVAAAIVMLIVFVLRRQRKRRQ